MSSQASKQRANELGLVKQQKCDRAVDYVLYVLDREKEAAAGVAAAAPGMQQQQQAQQQRAAAVAAVAPPPAAATLGNAAAAAQLSPSSWRKLNSMLKG